MNKSRFAVSWKRLFASFHDALMAGAALLIAVGARYGVERMPDTDLVLGWTLAFMALALVVFRLFGLGRGMWRFASVTDLRAIVLASAVTVIAFTIGLFVFNRLEGFPRTAPVIAWFVMIVLIGAPRLAYRAFKDGGLAHIRPGNLAPERVENLLIIGSASDADRVIRTFALERSPRYRVRGIVDYSVKKRGRNVRGVPIVGDVSDLEAILERCSRNGTAIDAAVLATPAADRQNIQDVLAIVARTGLPLRRVAATALTSQDADLTALTVEDLLGRPPVRLDLENIRALISGRVVLVTGAGGSIGSEIVRQVSRFGPARMVLLESSEYALYTIDREMAETSPVARAAVIADVRDRARLDAIIRAERPSLVFHAAALKHVPLVEDNPCEGILTDAIGTMTVADAALAAGVEAVVVISTDKAIRPTSVMGASKRAAEMYCQAVDVAQERTRFVTVRFGNVLGSTGSVVPLFRRQIERGGPLTVTDPEMRRYFMTVAEATELVLQAAASGTGSPERRGRIYVLDMGEPVRILDLARTMIALAGLRPEIDVSIVHTGLRPGEKLFEELFEPGETTLPSGADGVFVATARVLELAVVRNVLQRLESSARGNDAATTRTLLRTLVPDLPITSQEHDRTTVARARDVGFSG